MARLLSFLAIFLSISVQNTATAETDFSVCDSIAKAEGRRLCYERLGVVKSRSDTIVKITAMLEKQLFSDAATLFSEVEMDIAPLEVKRLEELALEVIKPMPSSKRSLNLEGYKFLNYLNPSNGMYALKIMQYSDGSSNSAILKQLKYNIDKFTKVKTLYHTSVPFSVSSGSRIRLTINVDTAGNASLRVATIYNADSWLWVEKVDVLVDGVSSLFTYGDFTRDNHTRIWEWREEKPNTAQLLMLRKIASADSVTMRFYGEEFYSDRKLRKADMKAIRDVLSVYDELIDLQLKSMLPDVPADFIPKKISRSVGSEPMRCYDPARKTVYSHSPYGMSCSYNDYPISDQDFIIFNKLKSRK